MFSVKGLTSVLYVLRLSMVLTDFQKETETLLRYEKHNVTIKEGIQVALLPVGFYVSEFDKYLHI